MSGKTILEVLEFYSNIAAVDSDNNKVTTFKDVEASYNSIEEIGRIVYDNEEIEKRRRFNLGTIIKTAFDCFIPHKEKIKNVDIDPDWLARYLDCAKDVSDNDMRLLWAKTLSGELNKPDSISLMTLETLHNMSKRDAKIFHKLASFAVVDNENGVTFIPNNGLCFNDECKSDKDYGIIYEELLWMKELRLIILNSDLGMSFIVDDKNPQIESTLSCGNLIIEITSKKRVDIPCYLYTRIGAQLHSLIEDITPNKEFFEDRIKNRYSSEQTKIDIRFS